MITPDAQSALDAQPLTEGARATEDGPDCGGFWATHGPAINEVAADAGLRPAESPYPDLYGASAAADGSDNQTYEERRLAGGLKFGEATTPYGTLKQYEEVFADALRKFKGQQHLVFPEGGEEEPQHLVRLEEDQTVTDPSQGGTQ